MPHEYRRRTDANLPLWPMGFVFLLAAVIGLVYLSTVFSAPSADLPPRTLAPLASDAEETQGQTLAVTGTVREQWGPKAFTIRDESGTEILVIDATQPLHDEAVSVSVPPPTAHVEGRAFRRQDPELRRHLPAGFDQRLIDDYAGQTVIVANAIREAPAPDMPAQ